MSSTSRIWPTVAESGRCEAVGQFQRASCTTKVIAYYHVLRRIHIWDHLTIPVSSVLVSYIRRLVKGLSISLLRPESSMHESITRSHDTEGLWKILESSDFRLIEGKLAILGSIDQVHRGRSFHVKHSPCGDRCDWLTPPLEIA